MKQQPQKPQTSAETKPRKIAILGFAGSSLDEAPLQDETWEIWGLNELWRSLPRWDVWFDLHPMKAHEARPGHLAWMQQQPEDKPIYLQEILPSVLASKSYPKVEMTRRFGPYFTSSIAYMLAMAIVEGPSQIGIWGVDMLHDSEYMHQRSCCDYYIGLARGMGISVYIPETSALAKSSELYGYDDAKSINFKSNQRRFTKREAKLLEAKDNGLRALHNFDGQLNAVEQIGKNGDLGKRIIKRFEEEGAIMPEGSVDVINEVVGTYCADLHNHISPEREKVLQAVYATDGSLQEMGYWRDVLKHILRKGV